MRHEIKHQGWSLASWLRGPHFDTFGLGLEFWFSHYPDGYKERKGVSSSFHVAWWVLQIWLEWPTKPLPVDSMDAVMEESARRMDSR